MKKIIYFFGVLCLLSSCKGVESGMQGSPVQDKSGNIHQISLDQALENLSVFYGSTKAELPKIDDIRILGRKDLQTKSSSDEDGANDSTLLYVVNYADSAGFAILAADDRIPEPVLAVTEQGKMTAGNLSQESNRKIYEGYPTTGPAIYPDPDNPDELILNPNTFEFYNIDEDDYFVGNFVITEDTEDGEDSDDSETELLADIVLNYASRKISSKDKPEEFPRRDTEPEWPGPLPGGGESTSTSKEVILVSEVSPMLSETVEWRQGYSPYNGFCPTSKKAKTDNGHLYTGCVPLAAAKILYYHSYPTTIMWDDFYIADMNVLHDLPDTTIWNEMIGMFLRGIGISCNSMYFKEGTFTFPARLKKFLRFLGYQDVSYDKYNTDNVIEHLDADSPVFICSIPDVAYKMDIGKCHAWTIDGYRMYTTKVIKSRYKNGRLVGTDIYETDPTTMVHCDWGWGGYCNGYFVSGVFDLTSSQNIYDENQKPGKSDTENYCNYLKTITFVKP